MRWFFGSIDLSGKHIDQETWNRTMPTPETSQSYETTTLVERNAAFSITTAYDASNSARIINLNDNYLVGDIRIDNRFDIVSKYNLPMEISESNELIFLYLFDRYGKESVKCIIGEFAFFIWNRRSQNVFAARDQLGIKTLFWILNDDMLWIASDIYMLKKHFSIQRINEEYFQKYYLCNGHIDSISTPFHEVSRLPSACSLSVENKTTRMEVYWDLIENQDEIKYTYAKQYEEHLLEILNEAVKCRITQNEKNAVLMSGGLDSTTIFSVGKQVYKTDRNTELFPVCGVFDLFKESDEREYIEPILQMYSTTAVYHRCDEHTAFKNFSDNSPWSYEPHVNAASFSLTSSLMHEAVHAGARNVLTGYGGDHVFNGSEFVIADFIKKGSFINAFKQANRFSNLCRLSTPKVLWSFGIAPQFNGGQYKKLLQFASQELIDKYKEVSSFSRRGFIKQITGTKARIYSDRVISPLVGVNLQHPFLDRRLVEFLYRIPESMLWSNGIRKYILRKTMKDYLPSKVLWRLKKTNHRELTFRGIQEGWNKLQPVIQEGLITQFGWATKEEWIDLINRWRQGQIVRDDMFLMITVEIWLQGLLQKK